jgi:hypothetical protein
MELFLYLAATSAILGVGCGMAEEHYGFRMPLWAMVGICLLVSIVIVAIAG